jgi:hypothetical protein
MTIARSGWEGLAGGRLSGVSLEGISGAGPDGLVEIARASLGALDWNRVDAGALATALTRFPGAGGGGAGGEGEVAPLAGEEEVAAAAGEEPAVEPAPAGEDGEEATAPPADDTTDLPEVETTEEEAAGDVADVAEAGDEAGPVFAAVEVFLALAEGELGGLLVEGVSVTPADVSSAGLRLGRLTLAELSRRRFGPLALDSLDVDGPDGRFGLAGLSYDGVIERLPLDELRAALPGLPRTPEGAARLRELLAGVAGRYEAGLASLAVTRPSDGAGLRLDRLGFSGTAAGDRGGTSLSVESFALDFGKLASGVRDEAELASAGLSRVAGRLRAGWGTDHAAGRDTLDRLELSLDGLGDLELEGAIESPSAEAVAASPPDALMALSLVRARLAYTDRSLVRACWRRRAARTARRRTSSPTRWPAWSPTRRARPGSTPESRAAVADFLRRPGRLEVELSPSQPAPMLDALTLATTAPAELGARAGPEGAGDAAAIVTGGGAYPCRITLGSIHMISQMCPSRSLKLRAYMKPKSIGLPGIGGAEGQRLVDQRVDGSPALGRQAGEHLRRRGRVGDRLAGELRELLVGEQHRIDVVRDDHAGGGVVGELGVERVAEPGEERDRALRSFTGKLTKIFVAMTSPPLGALLRDDRDTASGLAHGVLDLVHALQALVAAGGVHDVVLVDPGLAHPVAQAAPVGHHDDRHAVRPAGKGREASLEQRERRLGGGEGDHHRERAGEGEVLPQQRLLRRLAKDEQEDEVERGEFAQRAAAGEAHDDQEQSVDRGGAQDRVHGCRLPDPLETDEPSGADRSVPLRLSQVPCRVSGFRRRVTRAGVAGSGRRDARFWLLSCVASCYTT